MPLDTTQYPFSSVVRITDTIGGVAMQASGVLIAPNEVLTASHVVWSQGIGVADNIVVTPGYDGAAPFGMASGVSVHFNPVADAGGRMSSSDRQRDYAVIHLDHSFPTAGTMGITPDFVGGTVNVAGFPGDLGGIMINSVQYEADDPSFTLLDGTGLGPGSSGGPVWLNDGQGRPGIVGIVSGQNAAGVGYNTLITTYALNNIRFWMQLDGSASIPGVVIDTAANVASELGSLESQAIAGSLHFISLTDPILPILPLGLTQLLGSIDALHLINGSFAVDVSSIGVHGNAPAVLAASLGASTRIVDIQFADGQLVYDPAAPAAQVFRLYQAAFGRMPDQAGLYNWVNLVKSGASLTALADGFIASPEFQLRAGTSLDDGSFISQLYLNVLHRGADPQGFAGWAAALATGTSRGQVMVGFSESAENKLATGSSIQAGIWDLDRNAPPVARLYDTVFGRLPDAGGLANWDHALGAGVLTLDQVATQFVQSAEFMATYGSLSNPAFINALYVNALHRAPDPGGQAIWTNTLNAGGLTRSGAVLGFSESQEHRNDTAGNIFGNDPASFGVRLA